MGVGCALALFGVFDRAIAIAIDPIIGASVGIVFTILSFCFILMATVDYFDINKEMSDRYRSDREYDGRVQRALCCAIVTSVQAMSFLIWAGLIKLG